MGIPRVTALAVDPGFLQLVAMVQFCSTGNSRSPQSPGRHSRSSSDSALEESGLEPLVPFAN